MSTLLSFQIKRDQEENFKTVCNEDTKEEEVN